MLVPWASVEQLHRGQVSCRIFTSPCSFVVIFKSASFVPTRSVHRQCNVRVKMLDVEVSDRNHPLSPACTSRRVSGYLSKTVKLKQSKSICSLITGRISSRINCFYTSLNTTMRLRQISFFHRIL